LAGAYFSNSTLQLLQQMMENARDSDGCIITDNMYQILGKASESKMSKEEPLKHPFMRAFDNLTQAHLVALKRSAIGDQYYGTGLSLLVTLYLVFSDCIVFVYDEPCPMCAMGMTHARIKTVFFKNPSSKGAFVTTCQLHLKPQLNHHYEVYQLEY
jgi:tRNA(Arg) A34 adenosine deaminase TadA